MRGKEIVETQSFISRALHDPVNLLYVCALEQRNSKREINDETNNKNTHTHTKKDRFSVHFCLRQQSVASEKVINHTVTHG